MNAFVQSLVEMGAQVVVEAIVSVVLGLGAAVFARNWARRGKVRVENGAGRTCHSPLVLLAGVLSGAMAAACLILGLVEPESLQERGALFTWVGLVGGFTFGFLVMAAYARHTWEWGPDGLGWRGVWRAVSIPWHELARVGTTWDGRFFAADRAGRRITWSTFTLEHEALAHAIATARPDLAAPGR